MAVVFPLIVPYPIRERSQHYALLAPLFLHFQSAAFSSERAGWLLVIQSSQTWQDFAFQHFQAGPTTGTNMRDFVRQSGLVDR